MSVFFRGSLSQLDIERAERLIAGHTTRPRYSAGPITICAAALLALVAFALLPPSGVALAVLLVVAAGVTGLGVVQSVQSLRRFRRRNDPIAQMAGEVSDAGLTFTSGSRPESIVAWPEFDAVRSTGRILVLDYRGRRFVLAPSLFPDRRSWKTVLGLAKRHGNMRLSAKSLHNVHAFVVGVVLVALVAALLMISEQCSYP